MRGRTALAITLALLAGVIGVGGLLWTDMTARKGSTIKSGENASSDVIPTVFFHGSPDFMGSLCFLNERGQPLVPRGKGLRNFTDPLLLRPGQTLRYDVVVVMNSSDWSEAWGGTVKLTPHDSHMPIELSVSTDLPSLHCSIYPKIGKPPFNVTIILSYDEGARVSDLGEVRFATNASVIAPAISITVLPASVKVMCGVYLVREARSTLILFSNAYTSNITRIVMTIQNQTCTLIVDTDLPNGNDSRGGFPGEVRYPVGWPYEPGRPLSIPPGTQSLCLYIAYEAHCNILFSQSSRYNVTAVFYFSDGTQYIISWPNISPLD